MAQTLEPGSPRLAASEHILRAAAGVLALPEKFLLLLVSLADLKLA